MKHASVEISVGSPPSHTDSFCFLPTSRIKFPDARSLPDGETASALEGDASSENNKPVGRVAMSLPHEQSQGPPAERAFFNHAPFEQSRTTPVPFSSPPRSGASPDNGHAAVSSSSVGNGVDYDDGVNGGLAEVMELFFQRTKRTPPLTLLWVALLVFGLMTGNAMILICVNFWLDQFPESGRYTVFAFSGFVFSLFFLSALGLYLVVRRPDLSFLQHAVSWKLLLWIGLMDTLNSALAIYAAPGTPEVLQALFASLVPVYAAAFTKIALKDPRQYCNGYVLVSFSLIIIGVMVASFFYLGGGNGDGGGSSESANSVEQRAAAFLNLIPFLQHVVSTHSAFARNGAGTTDSSNSCFSSSSSSSEASSQRAGPFDTILWSVVYFFSVIPTVLMNGGQTLFMTRFTYDENFASDAQRILAHDAGREDGDDHDDGTSNASGGEFTREADNTATAATAALSSDDPDVLHPFHASDATVKLVMLAGGTTIQSVLTLLLFPMDALPWFGSSESVTESWSNFKAGIDCIFHCPNNFVFCVLYCLGFLIVYVSAAYLNQYSVTLCSMVTQLAAPCTAIIIVLFPVLNPSHDATPWYVSTISACILGMGTFIYVVWDEQTEKEKHMGEVRLKMKMLGFLDGQNEVRSREIIRTDAQNRPVEYVLVQSHEEGP